jgi:hypothetical protein
MTNAPALFALLALHLPWTHGDARGEAHRVAGWTVTAHVERFTGRMACQVTRPGVAYRRQALVFRLSPRIDTSAAVYRVDAGAPVWARTDEPELARLGFALHGDDLNNPSGGVVRVPQGRLAGARAVQIETAADHRPFKFVIAGLAEALDAAKRAGCGDADFS